MLRKAQQLCISGSVSQAIALLENVVNVALHRNSPGLHVSALSQMAEVVLTLDAKLSLKLIEQAKAVLEQHPYLPSVGLKRLLDIRRCLAYLWIGDLERARAAFDALDRVSSDNPLYGDELWIDAQLALRERPPHEAATVGRGLIEWARGNEYLLHEWRGFLVVAAASVAAVLLVFLLPRTPSGPAVLFKGSLVSISLKRGEQVTSLRDGDVLREGDALRFSVKTERAGHALVLNRDGQGKVTVVAPFNAKAPQGVPEGTTVLDDSAVLDATRGKETFVTVFAPAAFEVASVTRQLEAGQPVTCSGCVVEVSTFDKP